VIQAREGGECISAVEGRASALERTTWSERRLSSGGTDSQGRLPPARPGGSPTPRATLLSASERRAVRGPERGCRGPHGALTAPRHFGTNM